MKPVGEAPDHFKIEMFVIRVGDWGGYMLVTCDDQLLIHQLTVLWNDKDPSSRK